MLRRIDRVAHDFNAAVSRTESIASEGRRLAEDVIILLDDALALDGVPVSSRRVQGHIQWCNEQAERSAICAVDFQKIEEALLEVRPSLQ